ncbi:MAG TPA: SNF2-related protein [Verrucomicrobiota bacterium]|nr:SNF2-related protein [Verrucomicrobiota bacterium]HNU51052.1 SNF2-related protein [Verrucomicrobiota bacterium]
MELTSELLGRIAGWQAVQEARGLVAAGRVSEAQWSPPRLEGRVREGTITYRVRCVIRSAVDAENLCTCRRASREGVFCAHAVAVGLAALAGPVQAAVPAAAPPSPGGGAAAASKAARASTPATVPASRPSNRLRRSPAPGTGERAWLHVILPPNLPQALARGRGMLVFEADWGGGRVPLAGLAAGKEYCFAPEDEPVLDAIEVLSGGEYPGMLVLSGEDFERVLASMAGHPRVTLGKNQELSIRLEPARLPIRARIEPAGAIRLDVQPAPAGVLAIGNRHWMLQGGCLQPVDLPARCRDLATGALRVPRSDVPLFLNQDWPVLCLAHTVDAGFALEDFRVEEGTLRCRLELRGTFLRIEARLHHAYGPHRWTAGGGGGSVSLPDPEDPRRYWLRDVEGEQESVARLVRCGFSAPDSAGRMALEGEHGVLNFFAREYPRLMREWTVTLEPGLETATQRRFERVEPRFTITPSGQQWFELGIEYATADGERLSAADLQRLLRSGQSHTRLRSGRTALIDTGAFEEMQETLRDCEPEQQGGRYRLAARQAGFIAATLEDVAGPQAGAPADWLEPVRRLSGGGPAACPDLGPLEPVLRPYQKQGVAWLWFLRRNRLGGVLADEMGLGKTLQALAFLQSVIAARKAGDPCAAEPGPSLVVCPTSLVFNWVAEARRYTPGLRVLALHGAGRQEQWTEVAAHDLIVTSYALIRRDAPRYAGIAFDTVILDEAQHIKNRLSQNAQAAKGLRARHRLVLTGTPLENSVLDLWSIFDFLMPAYLGSAREFRERYEIPIARDRDPAVQRRLGRRVRPFLLRRLKREVAPELPARIEHVAYCDLSPEQAAAYRQVLEAGRNAVLDAAGPAGSRESRLLVLTTLLRLRQVCCDLRLLDLPGSGAEPASAKLALFLELLEEVLDGGHRVLVFSQFTRMLALLREALDARETAYSYLDGATVDRAEAVQRFQSRPDIPVFLISLKAGGTGLNLTGADTVFHFDPWWNPAAEAQATDRAHRIGQTRVVTCYKLIARGTVEEKILALQDRKRAVLGQTLGDEESLTETLTWDEIRELLAD